MAAFEQVFISGGVDEDRLPKPGMIVPQHGFNIVRLTGGKDRRAPASTPQLKITEMSTGDVLLAGLLLNPGGFLKPSVISDARYFKIASDIAISLNKPTRIEAVGKFGSTALDVAVVKQKKVKLAIRPVMTVNSAGALVPHSKKIGNPEDLAAVMNSIWTPQANVVFDLVSKQEARIVDKAKIAKALGVSQDQALPETINMTVFADILSEFKDKNADLTMFLVQNCSFGKISNPNSARGVTRSDLGISLISDNWSIIPELMAHEAGHFLFFKATGEEGHIGGNNALMKDGGSPAAKVPFGDVQFFNPP